VTVEEQPGALAGVRVLDFTRVLAGPFATMMLADLGADVVKVESPEGDDTRAWGPPWHGDDDRRHSAYYLSVNRNKRSIALDLKQPGAQRLALELAARAHILVENFRPGGMAAFGLGYEQVRAVNPAIVYASITGYGQTGPYRDRPGYDFVIQGQSGLMSITGASDGPPTKVGVAVSDVFAGLFACSSILAALRHAERTGQGQHVDIALLDAQIAALVNIAANALVSGQIPARLGSAHPSIVPYQPFRACDRMFCVAVGNDRQFRALCAVVGHPEWADEPRFATNPDRVVNRDALIPLLDAAFITRPASDWVRDLLAAGVPAGEINDVRAALDDPQVRARGLIRTVTLNGQPLDLIGPPVQFSVTPPDVRLPPPDIGEHTDVVLADWLGLTPQQIAEHRQAGDI
jgi:crotonobetainyl-CoA:carnitine CoA-transferase CaiB-like acyl-CoA transferase